MRAGEVVTFDIDGRQLGNGDVQIGCHTFTMEQVRGASDSVKVKGSGKVKIKGVRGNVSMAQGPSGYKLRVEFADVERKFLAEHVEGQAKNLTVVGQADAAPAAAEGGPVARVLTATNEEGKTLTFVVVDELTTYRVKGKWGPVTLDEWKDDYPADDGWVWSDEEGQNVQAAAAGGNPDPATLRWQSGDQVIWNEPGHTGARTRDANGDWFKDNGQRRRTGRQRRWTDASYERMIAQGKVRILRKGGVGFHYDA